MTELANLIEIVAAELQSADWSYGAQGVSGRRITKMLVAEYGAKIVNEREPMTLSLGGVRASSAGGYPGLLGNWVSAARRRLGR